MTKDSIVAEVRAIREAYAARFGFDVGAMVRDLQEREKSTGRKVLFPDDAKYSTGDLTEQPTISSEASR